MPRSTAEPRCARRSACSLSLWRLGAPGSFYRRVVSSATEWSVNLHFRHLSITFPRARGYIPRSSSRKFCVLFRLVGGPNLDQQGGDELRAGPSVRGGGRYRLLAALTHS